MDDLEEIIRSAIYSENEYVCDILKRWMNLDRVKCVGIILMESLIFIKVWLYLFQKLVLLMVG